MSPIRLFDAELLSAARPIDVRVRDEFLKSVANALKGCSVRRLYFHVGNLSATA
jgi:hypothetical protein